MNRLPPVNTRFPVNRQNHTQKGKYLTPILKKILTGKWDIKDEKIKALLKTLKLPETIATSVVLRRILNACEGDDLAIERIFDRVDGKLVDTKIDQSQHTQYVIFRNPDALREESKVSKL